MSDRLGLGLVHGGFHGGWCWSEVIKRLDYPCVAVDLPGRDGDTEALGQITYTDWVRSAATQIATLPTRDIILVAHSLGGITIPQVAARLSDRVRHVVFMATVMPAEGQSFLQANGIGDLKGPVWPIPPLNIIEAMLCNDMPAGSAAGLHAQLCPEPTGPLRHPISRAQMPKTGTTFIKASRDNSGCLSDLDSPSSALLAEFPTAKIVRIDGGHNLMMTAADEVAEVLRGLARRL